MLELTAPALKDADALFIDFDGTLAPIQDRADTVAMIDGAAPALEALFARLGGAVAIISGRDIRDLSTRTPNSLWRAGGHGLEICAPGAAPAAEAPPANTALIAAVETGIAELSGVHLEVKGPVLAVHYRAAPEHALAALKAVEAAAASVEGYKTQTGKMVVELKPLEANKGAALRAMMAEAPFKGRRPVMVGDDTTDEDAFAAALDQGGVAVKVGEGETCAPDRLPSPEAVRDWLVKGAQG